MELLTLMRDRRSLRVPYDRQRRISKEDLRRIVEAARWAPTAHNMQNFQIVVVDDRDALAAIGKMGFSLSEVFVRENYRQLSLSEEEKKAVGARVPLEASAALLVVVYDPRQRAPASEGDFLGIMSIGCVMENMWLMANSLGIGLHILSSLAADPAESELKRVLDIPGHLKVAFTCRLGYPVGQPGRYLRVRRDVDDVAHYNRFGQKGLGA